MFLPADFTPTWSLPPDAPTGDGYWFIFQAGKLLLINANEGLTEVPRLAQSGDLPFSVADIRCIGTLHGSPCWAAEAVGAAGDLPSRFSLSGLRSLFGSLPEEQLAVAGRAQQVVEFHRSHRYCGACATVTETHDEARARRCPGCGCVFYPRIAPAMMVLIKRDTTAGRELLLARGSRFPGAFYSALAGFLEPSESIEECIHREVREEVGLRVRALRYYGSEAWPFPHSLMIAFVADYDGGEITCQPGEIEDAQWFSLDRLPALPRAISVSRRLINYAIAEVAPNHPALSE